MAFEFALSYDIETLIWLLSCWLTFLDTDFMVQDAVFGSELPITASHEVSWNAKFFQENSHKADMRKGAGTVVGMGSQVSDWKGGERVMCPIISGRCGSCADCKGDEKYQHYCANVQGHRGVTMDGAFAEYMLVSGSPCHTNRPLRPIKLLHESRA